MYGNFGGFMKKLRFVTITALVTVIGFAFIACDDGNNNNENNTGGNTGTTGTVPTLVSITAVYTPTTEIFPDTTLVTLKEGLTVTAHYSDSTTAPVTAYNLSIEGEEFTVGENTVTVNYTEGGITKTTTFKVTVDELTHAHNWQLKEVINPATCTTAGMGKWECTNITPSHYEDLEIAALDHDWNDTYTTIANATETTDGVEAITCKRDSSHTKEPRFNGEYATGTLGLSYSNTTYYDLTTNTNKPSYKVSQGTATGAVHIPAFHRPNADSPYLPVTYLTGFAGTSSAPNTTLTSVTFAPTSVTFAPNSQIVDMFNTFAYCTALTSIEIPASVIQMYSTFANCTSLASVTFAPNSQLEDISGYDSSGTFGNCTSLTSITIPASVKYLGQASGDQTEGYVFDGCTSLVSVTFEEGSQLEVIGFAAFRNCTSLTSITIPASVRRLAGSFVAAQNGTFYGCTSLASVTFEGTIPSSEFQAYAFPAASMGDLRAKYLAEGGGIGTYTTTAPVSSTSVWTKQ